MLCGLSNGALLTLRLNFRSALKSSNGDSLLEPWRVVRISINCTIISVLISHSFLKGKSNNERSNRDTMALFCRLSKQKYVDYISALEVLLS
jgi:hypothetical protein